VRENRKEEKEKLMLELVHLRERENRKEEREKLNQKHAMLFN